MSDGWNTERPREEPRAAEGLLGRFWDSIRGGTPEERRREGQFGPLVGLTCEEALDELGRHFTQLGARITDRSKHHIACSYRKGPEAFVLLVLLLLFILPAILYWMAASRDVHFTITATPDVGGCRLLFGGERSAVYEEFLAWVEDAPSPNPNIVVPEEAVAAEGGEMPAGVPDQIRELAKLRDAGIVSQEEFEMKKRDLLDRM